MAQLFYPDGRIEEVKPAHKKKKFTLDELQTLVGGDIEKVPCRGRHPVYCNESGKLLGLPFNAKATEEAHRRGWLGLHWDYLSGCVLFTEKGE